MKPNITLTAIIEKSEDGWYVGQLEEMPEVLSQGKTVKELISNLKDALNLILDTSDCWETPGNFQSALQKNLQTTRHTGNIILKVEG
jgi:predicted RNase H-like HicB family nuclease